MDEAKELAVRAHRLHQLKKEAIAYYQQNGAPQKMEESLNLMFNEKPDCVFGYLSNFFHDLASPPSISGVTCRCSCDSRGVATVAASVACRFKNKEETFSSCTAVVQHSVYEHDKQEAKDKELEELSQHVQAAIDLVADGGLKELGELSLDPRDQRKVDEFLLSVIQAEEQRLKEEYEKQLDETAENEEAKESSQQPKPKEATGSAKKKGKGKEIVIIPDEPREGFVPGSLAIGCLSAACAVAGAAATQLPLYEHLRRVFDADNSAWRLPLPMITILCGGKASPGKSNCVKEYMLVPRPGLPFDQVLPAASSVYQHLAKTLGVKAGPAVRLVNDVGALNVTIDRPEAGFELLNETLRSLELTESFQLAANIAGHELFDYEKGKYDLAQGTQKTADELADFFDDMLNKQPGIVAIVDPMRRVEKEAWTRLCHRVSERCLVVGDFAHRRPGLLVDEEADELPTSGWAPRIQQRTTVSEVFDCARKMKDAGNVVIPSVGPSDTSSTAIVDLAVALDARFVKFGAPVRSEKIDKFLRLVEIGEELQRRQLLQQWEELVPQSLKPPEPETPHSCSADKEPSGSAARSRKSSSNARQ